MWTISTYGGFHTQIVLFLLRPEGARWAHYLVLNLRTSNKPTDSVINIINIIIIIIIILLLLLLLLRHRTRENTSTIAVPNARMRVVGGKQWNSRQYWARQTEDNPTESAGIVVHLPCVNNSSELEGTARTSA